MHKVCFEGTVNAGNDKVDFQATQEGRLPNPIQNLSATTPGIQCTGMVNISQKGYAMSRKCTEESN